MLLDLFDGDRVAVGKILAAAKTALLRIEVGIDAHDRQIVIDTRGSIESDRCADRMSAARRPLGVGTA